MFTVATVLNALELGFIYALVAMALFLSFRVLNIADMTTDGAFTLGCAVSATAAVAGHPFLGLPLAMLAGAAAGFVTAFLQTRLAVPSILAGIITNTGLYTVNLAVMGFSSNVPMLKTVTIFTAAQGALGEGAPAKLLVAVVITVAVCALLIAFLVHSCRLKAVQYATRTLIYFPVLATTASVAIAWNYMFNENRGVINWLLQQVGILGPDQNVRWLISTETAMWAIVIFSAWKFIGQHFLYYFVGLQNIPDTYYEAAKIDGANSLQMFWKVTLPLITPTIFFILMVSLTGTMQAFDEALLRH